VISFQCHSEFENCSFIANGLSEEIVIGLGLFKELRIKGPLRRKNLKDNQRSIKDIGKEFEVGFVLDGTLRRRGDQLRLNVRLNETINAEQLWGKVLDCDVTKGSISDFEEAVISLTVSSIADNYGIISRYFRNRLGNKHTENPSTYEAILKYYHHFIALTAESQMEATSALENALEKEPDNATVNAMLGDLITSTYQFGYSDSIDLLDRGKKLGRRSIALDPSCQAGHFLMGLIHFLEDKKKLCFKEFNKALELNPNNAHYVAAISLHLAMAGEWERGVTLMNKACDMNPHYPGWHHLVYFMNFYRQGKYDLALQEANDFNTPDYYVDPLIRAAVLGQLGEKVDGKRAVENLLALMPDFLDNGKSRMRRFFFSDEHQDMIWDGLIKAGLEEI
jgi:adenylate cyclase